MPAWQWTQLVLGLSIPYLLVEHTLATGGGILRNGLDPNYEFILAVFWHFSPYKGWLQVVLLVVAWTHACIGIHHWLKVYPWYPKWLPHLYGIAMIIPVMALLGYVSGGFEVLEKMKNPLWFIGVLREINYPGPSFDQWIGSSRDMWMIGYSLLIVATFIARRARIYVAARKEGVRATYPSGRRVLIPPGATLLETSRAGNIPHASVCGGRGRCSTCRVLIFGSDPGSLDPPAAVESRILKKLDLPPNVRLACQVKPKGNVSCEPLLPPDVSSEEALAPGRYMHGQELNIAVMFADLRGFTKLSESKLPFDVVFMLNQYFQSMGHAIEDAGGKVDKFIGDGIMALFGSREESGNTSDQALAAARAMSEKLIQMNEQLKNDLDSPLKLGIGIHKGPAIVGTMGYGEATQITAIGDTVNTASRIESLTKDFDVQLLVSSDIEQTASIKINQFEQIEVSVRGRANTLSVRKIKSASNLPELSSLEKTKSTET
jgi:adenylate cyclase